MKQSKTCLLALLSILTLVATTTLAIAEEGSAHASGSVEFGATGTEIKDNPARVNEYTPYTSEEGLNTSTGINLEVSDKGYALDLESSVKGSDDQTHSLGIDLNRVLRLNFNYLEFQHLKDHETLDQMGATARGDIGGAQPNVTTDKIFADLIEATGNPAIAVGGSSLSGYDPAAAYQEEISNDYMITRREYKAETDLALPFAPNVVIHAGYRVEEREGMEQAIGLSKCKSCHVSAVGKNIDERTEDFTLGATGKFGIVTVDYEYMNRDFAEQAAPPTRFYYNSAHTNDYQLSYGNNDDGMLELSKTPDSEKDSHSLRVRADFSNSTNMTASYVNAEVESTKQDEPEYNLLNGNTLTTEYESFGGKVATKVGDVRLSMRGSTYEIKANDNEIYFPGRADALADASLDLIGDTDHYVTGEEREVKELGIDAVYRLATGTTLRLGYEFEDVVRDEDELGNTETHTLKAAVKARVNKKFSGRVSYEYQNIDEPLAGAHVGIAQGDLANDAIQDPLDPNLWYYTFAAPFTDGDVAGNNDWYWNIVYPNRQLSSSNQPEEVHEAKAATTWAISHNMAATVFARVRMEENDAVKYEQKTYVPGVTLWYAPNSDMNLTMAYTFNKQETENQMCVGWYHG